MTDELVSIEREGDLFLLTMSAGENRWNTTFTRAFDAALDEIDKSSGRAALVTLSADAKFFSNGLDLDWISSRGEHPGGDPRTFSSEVMALFARLITLPIPTVCALNGHAFGAGLMIALCHDVRVMNVERGFLCANEVELGFAIPEPELALFRHKIPMPAFFETVQLARRWTGPDALEAGVVQAVAAPDKVRETALTMAGDLLRLAGNREVFGWMKERIYGENAAIHGDHGPAYMLRNQDQFASGPGSVPPSPAGE
ncbi:MAG: enoyl-CoA hydratase/isomerase family protein [Actinomycetia bacterium]|nr:enoyl-CoA hydratase/isomerase family protein [Actinomycetes bacterium]MCP4086867.1 enoyl-CoA hydratase/isomerase family protein [Actinomycetes bacterium]